MGGKYPKTDEQRQRWQEYTKCYRREHPEKVKQWRRNYIMRAAARLQAEQARQMEGGVYHD